MTTAVREYPLPVPAGDRLLVEVHYSAISAGTELLVFQGQIPEQLAVDDTLPAYSGIKFEYPLQYGYSCVGRVVSAGPRADQAWLGRWVFAFQPHQSHYLADAADLIPLPEGMAPHDAVFLSGMETAVNLVMDGRPMIGEKVLVLGQGVIGLLTTALLALHPLRALSVVDQWPVRREAALRLGADTALSGREEGLGNASSAILTGLHAEGRADLIYELTGQPAMLNTAIEWAGFGARIVVGSWYGKKSTPIELGGRFHRNRIQLMSSQVSTLNPSLTGRWTRHRRLALAWSMLERIRPCHLISHRFSIHEAQTAFEQISRSPDETLQVIFTYGNT
ncbi:MAG: zinc-dependent alcohol dehydrogenase [Desulfobacterales bacterium]